MSEVVKVDDGKGSYYVVVDSGGKERSMKGRTPVLVKGTKHGETDKIAFVGSKDEVVVDVGK